MAKPLSEKQLRRLINGRVIVITGASRGLGYGLADRYAELGATLGLCARSRIDRPSGVAEQVDVTDPAAIAEFCDSVNQQLGPIDMWINNAGVLDPVGPLRSVDAHDAARHIAINVMGVFNGSQTYIRHTQSTSRPGALINISSGAALQARAGWSVYCASKAAVDRMTETIAIEQPDMKVFAVAPGVVDTDMQSLIRAQDPESFPSVDQFIDMKRDDAFNSPEWVADRIAEVALSNSHRPSETVFRVQPQP